MARIPAVEMDLRSIFLSLNVLLGIVASVVAWTPGFVSSGISLAVINWMAPLVIVVSLRLVRHRDRATRSLETLDIGIIAWFLAIVVEMTFDLPYPLVYDVRSRITAAEYVLVVATLVMAGIALVIAKRRNESSSGSA